MYQCIFHDYFTRTTHLRDDVEGWYSFKFDPVYYKIHPEGKFPTLDGKRANATTKYNKEDLELYEKDVDINLRVLLDIYMEDDTPPKIHNRVFLDIEIEKKGAINLSLCQKAPGKVTAVALYDSITKDYHAYVLDEDRKLQTSKNGDTVVIPCRNESELFEKFIIKWQEIDPTILITWNGDGFDIPYLYNRMKRVMGERFANKLSPIGIVKFDEWDVKAPYKIGGVNSLDLLRVYKKFIPKQQPSYSLDAISTAELGKGKIKYDGSLDNLFRTDPDKFIEYNVNDVRLIVEIDAKKKFIDLAIMLAHRGHVPYHYVYQSSKLIEGAIMTYLKRKGIVSPNKPTTINPELRIALQDESEDDDKFAGAYVKDCIPGLYGWNIDEDLTSLYPSLGILLNAGFETLLFKIITEDPFDDSWNLKDMKEKDQTMVVQVESKDGRIKYMKLSKLIKFIEDHEVIVSPNGVGFDSKTPSIIVEVMIDWFKQRKEYSGLMQEYGAKGDTEKYEYYDRIQSIMKIFLNSIYGVLGLQSFRYTDGKDYLASAITSGGRLTIMRSADFVNDIIHTDTKQPEDQEVIDYVFMSDTDSLYIDMRPVLKYADINTEDDNEVIEFTAKYAERMSNKLNKFYQTFTPERFNSKVNRLEMKSETIGKSLYVSAKKQYAQFIVYKKGVYIKPDSKDAWDFKGLDFFKSSTSKLFRDFGQGLIKDVLFNKPKQHIDKCILDFRETFKTLPIEDCCKPTGLNKYKEYHGGKGKGIFSKILPHCPVNTKASIFHNDILKFRELDKQYSLIQVGDKIRWAYVKPNPFNIEVVAYNPEDPCPDILDFIEKYIDREAIFDKGIVLKLQKIYTNLKWGKINFNSNTLRFFKFL